MPLLLSWLIHSLALLALPWLMDSVRVDGFLAAVVAAAVLGLVNALIRPVLVFLTLPVTLLTLGFFIFVINGLTFWAVASLLPGFTVAGFWPAVGAALLYSLISWALSTLLSGLSNKT